MHIQSLAAVHNKYRTAKTKKKNKSIHERQQGSFFWGIGFGIDCFHLNEFISFFLSLWRSREIVRRGNPSSSVNKNIIKVHSDWTLSSRGCQTPYHQKAATLSLLLIRTDNIATFIIFDERFPPPYSSGGIEVDQRSGEKERSSGVQKVVHPLPPKDDIFSFSSTRNWMRPHGMEM